MRINNATTMHASKMLLVLAYRRSIVSSFELSKILDISQRYLLYIAARLRDAGFISVTHGSSGGYKLLLDPKNINFYDIIIIFQKDKTFVNLIDPEIEECHIIRGLTEGLCNLEREFELQLKNTNLQQFLQRKSNNSIVHV